MFCCVFFACEKKELPVEMQDRGDVVTTQIEMKPDYRNQVWQIGLGFKFR